MVRRDPGELIRCDCGHSASQHSAAGCSAGPALCRCLKTPSAVVQDELAFLRPEWFGAASPAGNA
jgi:hypothetical protein